MRWLDGITNLMVISLSKLWDLVTDREACRLWGCTESDMTDKEKKEGRKNQTVIFHVTSEASPRWNLSKGLQKVSE